MKKILLIIIGCILLVLGGVGIFIPILPTTPFVLLAAICFSSSSTKLYNRLANTKYFGSYIRNYKDKTGVEKKVKVVSIVFLWTLLIISAAFIRKWWIILILAVVGIAVTIHLLLIRTKKPIKPCISAPKFLVCRHCGNLIESIAGKSIPLECCGVPMIELLPNALLNTHVDQLPIVTVERDIVRVDINIAQSTWDDKCSCCFAYLVTNKGVQHAYFINANCVTFCLIDDKPLCVYVYHNIYGLWKMPIK